MGAGIAAGPHCPFPFEPSLGGKAFHGPGGFEGSSG